MGRHRSVCATGLALLVGQIAFAEGATPSRADCDASRAAPFAEVSENWPLAPERAETLLREGDFEILSERYAGAGLTGASRVEIRLREDGSELSLKWKRMPRRFDGLNNAPRKEIAAYRIQSLLLEPHDYVVPTTVARCMPPHSFPRPHEHDVAAMPGSRCDLGVLSVWLEHVRIPDRLFNEQRFRLDPVYAYYLSNFNLVTYLIEHKDGRKGNFLAAKNPARPMRFSVDNGVAFGGIWYNWFVRNWKELRVPALRRHSVDRLRDLTRDDLESLGVVAQLELGEDGMIRSAPAGPNRDPDDGATLEGGVLQLGLTRSEIDDVYERIEDLLDDVDDGDFFLF